MTQRQRATVRYLFYELQVTELHHGDCVGSDAEVHKLAVEMHVRTVAHPPTDSKLRAYCNANEVRTTFPYLERNRTIVLNTDGLIATPKDFKRPKNLRGQGTWTTIGYAEQAGRRVWIVFPDGTFISTVAIGPKESTT